MFESAFTPLVVPRVGETPIDVRNEADRARTRGYADGFAEGRRVALDEGRAQQAAQELRAQELHEAFLHERGSALRALASAQTALGQRIDALSTLGADRIEQLAVELAESILGAELSDPARSAAHALRRALAQMPADRWTKVSFSVRDADVLDAGTAIAEQLHGVRFTASDDVDLGGAIVEIEDGAVDTRVAQAMARASAALRGEDRQGDAADEQMTEVLG